MSGDHLQEKEPAVRQRLRRLEAGQDTTEFVLLIILFALAFTAGFMVWTRSVNDSYDADDDCVTWSSAEAPPAGTLLAEDGAGEPDDSSGQEDRPLRRCPSPR